VFTPARQAYADGYDIWEGDCPSYASGHDCSPGCGPSTVFADACVTAGAYAGFHKNDGVTWTLRPNQCYSGTYDGWLWRFSEPCGTCGCGIERRCHDGYRSTGSGWVRSICRWTTECGCPGAVDWPTVARGARGPDVTAVQHLLTHRGVATDADGVFGPDTQAGVTAFQQAGSLPATGTVDAATWQALIATVRQNDRGDAVRAAQVQLTKHGHDLTADGIFGPLSHSATTAFQQLHDLTADGIVGPQTWRHLTGTV
ncbi:peptidoglycan-binding protein, partial [Streptomyces sp. SM14]